MKEKIGWQSDYADRLPWMVSGAKIEIIPFKSVWKSIDLLPPGSNIAVTSSPSKGIETTLNFIPELIQRGFSVIPHLAARSIRNFEHLKSISAFLEEQNVEEIFAIAGDNENPVGEYSNSVDMLEDLLNVNHSIKSIGVGGYPEGHPKIDHETLENYLKAKIVIAEKHGIAIHIDSQACYDSKKIIKWIQDLRQIRIHLPIFLGVPTPTDVVKLAAVSKEIGVGDSISFLKLTGVGSVLKSMTYDPTEFLESFDRVPEAEAIEGLHIFTFNNLTSTVEWQKNFKPVHN